jgi:hypothetical protein
MTATFSLGQDEDFMAQWFRTLQHLLAEVNALEGKGLESILSVASGDEFPQFVAILTSLRDRLNQVLTNVKGLSVNLVDIDSERT